MKKLIALSIVALGCSSLSGCFSLVDWDHNLNHLIAWNNQLDDVHTTFDYYFLDYDQDDPSRMYNYESPNAR